MQYRPIFTLLIALLSAATVSAEVLFTDQFDAAVGTSLESYNAWYTPYDGESGVTLTNGLTFVGSAMSGVGNAVLLDGECGTYQPHHAFTPVTTDSVYVAFLFQPTIVYKAGWFLSLRDAYSASSNTFNYVARVHISADSYLGLRVYKTADAVYDDTFPLDGQKVYLVVMKYVVASGAVSLYAFDTMSPSEPSLPLIGPLTDAAAPKINPENVVLRSFDDYSWLVLDGLRVATTWAEAVASVTTDLSHTTSSENGENLDKSRTTPEPTPCFDLSGKPVPPTHSGIILNASGKYLRRNP